MSEFSWLTPHIALTVLADGDGPAEVQVAVELAEEHGLGAVVVPSSYVSGAQSARSDSSLRIIAAAGYPTGRHPSLVKAAEARLSVQTGADEVWVCLDRAITDTNSVLSELVMLREAVPTPAKLAVLGSLEQLPVGSMAGADTWVMSVEAGAAGAGPQPAPGDTKIDLTAWVRGEVDFAEAVEALSAGASRLAVPAPPPAQFLAALR